MSSVNIVVLSFSENFVSSSPMNISLIVCLDFDTFDRQCEIGTLTVDGFGHI